MLVCGTPELERRINEQERAAPELCLKTRLLRARRL